MQDKTRHGAYNVVLQDDADVTLLNHVNFTLPDNANEILKHDTDVTLQDVNFLGILKFLTIIIQSNFGPSWIPNLLFSSLSIR